MINELGKRLSDEQSKKNVIIVMDWWDDIDELERFFRANYEKILGTVSSKDLAAIKKTRLVK